MTLKYDSLSVLIYLGLPLTGTGDRNSQREAFKEFGLCWFNFFSLLFFLLKLPTICKFYKSFTFKRNFERRRGSEPHLGTPLMPKIHLS